MIEEERLLRVRPLQDDRHRRMTAPDAVVAVPRAAGLVSVHFDRQRVQVERDLLLPRGGSRPAFCHAERDGGESGAVLLSRQILERP